MLAAGAVASDEFRGLLREGLRTATSKMGDRGYPNVSDSREAVNGRYPDVSDQAAALNCGNAARFPTVLRRRWPPAAKWRADTDARGAEPRAHCTPRQPPWPA